MSSKTNKYTLDAKAADDMLQNILKSCDIKPNDIPLNVLEVRHAHKFVYLHILRLVCAILFILTLISPFAFVRPAEKMVVEHRALHNLNIIEHKHEGDYFYITLNSDFQVDVESSFIQTDSGFESGVCEFNIQTNQIVFPYPSENSTLYIYTIDGELLQLYLQVLQK